MVPPDESPPELVEATAEEVDNAEALLVDDDDDAVGTTEVEE